MHPLQSGQWSMPAFVLLLLLAPTTAHADRGLLLECCFAMRIHANTGNHSFSSVYFEHHHTASVAKLVKPMQAPAALPVSLGVPPLLQ